MAERDEFVAMHCGFCIHTVRQMPIIKGNFKVLMNIPPEKHAVCVRERERERGKRKRKRIPRPL